MLVVLVLVLLVLVLLLLVVVLLLLVLLLRVFYAMMVALQLRLAPPAVRCRKKCCRVFLSPFTHVDT